MPAATCTEPNFKLQFPAKEIPKWAARYNAKSDTDALAAGKRIANGSAEPRDDLAAIFKWKTRNRGKSRLLGNSDEEIADALGLATAAATERSAVAVLRGLSGVDTPVASAILTAIDPQHYTVIDVRALEALGYAKTDRGLPLYLSYLRYCRATAQKHGVSLRTLDRALWQWSYERQRAEEVK